MDIVTQGIAGALMAQLGAGPEHKRQASIVGFAAGLLPDADALIRSSSDPLLTLEFHRQFSHSLLFIPIGALIVSLILMPFMRGKLPFSRLYLFCLLGYSSAGLLDACTSFGTQLLWPFSDERIAWNLISIVDPVFSIGLLIAVITGWHIKQRRYAVLGIGFATLYLSLSFMQQQAALQMQHNIALERGHTIERGVIKPTMANIMLWRSVYQYQGHYYVDAVRPAIFGKSLVYSGSSIAAYQPAQQTRTPVADSTQSRDIVRFDKLSNGYLVIHPDDKNVLGDVRYAMLPNSTAPLWGIRLDPENPHQHTTEALFRKSDAATRRQFIDMLIGDPPG
ncbi:MAG: metal-dependent hydrolase [Gammaproteobacteria bacterium]|nr:metal-dependent hydrolase [Gammaproteobacteria bacterium]